MSKLNFFDQIVFLLETGDKVDLKIQKTDEEELTVLVVQKSKGKRAMFTCSGDGEELDENFIDDLSKPLNKISHSTADDAEVEEDEEEDEDDAAEKAKASTSKKSPAKKEAPKEEAPKKKTPAAAKEETDKQVKEALKDPAKVAEAKAAIKEDKKKMDEAEAVDQISDEQKIANAATKALEEEEADKKAKAELAAKAEEEEAAAQAEAKEKEEKEAANKLQRFNELMEKGRADFLAHRYVDYENAYKEASELFPDHEKAATEYKKAKDWVDRLIEAEALPPRKEAGDGV